MKPLPNDPVVGRFILNGEKYWGQLFVSDGDTRLTLFSEEFIRSDFERMDSLEGELVDGSSVTLVNVIPMAVNTAYGVNKKTSHSLTLYPHFVIRGGFHVDPQREEISRLRFSIADGGILFHDTKSFGAIHGKPEMLADILKHQGVQEGDAVGDFPTISYFNGNHTISSVVLDWGVLEASHSFSVDSFGTVGERDVMIDVVFNEPRYFEATIDLQVRFIRFAEMLIGRPQKPENCNLVFPDSPDGSIRTLEFYWCSSLSKPIDPDAHESRPSPYELPVNGGVHKDEFAVIARGFFNKEDGKFKARYRVCGGLMDGRRYTNERLVTAANSFDLLPDELFPTSIAISAEMKKAKDEARALFKALPDSPERQSILGALGRLGTMTLKQKVRHRALPILALASHRLPDFVSIIDRAVDMRNHLVHGSDGRIDWSKADMSFLVDTLEFVFIISDLLENGLNGKRFFETPSSGGVPLLHYPKDYSMRAHAFKAGLGLV